MTPEERLRGLRVVQRTLDEAFRVPGTRIRFGWDNIIGLVPWAGDAVTAVMAGVIIVQAQRLGVPRVVLGRMLINAALDLVIGIVPVAGDVADVFWKADTRNMRLLERHVATPGPARAGDWFFVSAVIVVIAGLALLPLLIFLLVWRAWT